MPKLPKLLRSDEGFLLVTAYMTLTSLMALSLALWTQANVYVRSSESSIYQMAAFQLAESGLDVAISNLTEDQNYAGAQNVNYDKNGQRIGTYSITVETPDAGNPFLRRVTSTGVTPDLGAGRGQMTRTIVSFVRLIPRQPFDFAFFTNRGMGFNGSPSLVVDSFDSRHGPYNSATATANGNAATNAVQNSAVDLDGNVTIKGSVSVGPTADPTTAITVSKNSTITGSTGVQPQEIVYEPAIVPADAIDLGAVSVQSTLTLAGGSYVMDSLSVSGNGSIQATGPVEIFIRGSASVGGNGVITASNRPKNMLIYVVGNGSVSYSGNGALYGAIYAPLSDVQVSGNGSIYGAVVADTYKQSGNGEFHFDEELKVQDTTQRLRAHIVSWREMNKYLS